MNLKPLPAASGAGMNELAPCPSKHGHHMLDIGAYANGARVTDRSGTADRRVGRPSRQEDEAANRVARLFRAKWEALRGHVYYVAQI